MGDRLVRLPPRLHRSQNRTDVNGASTQDRGNISNCKEAVFGRTRMSLSLQDLGWRVGYGLCVGSTSWRSSEFIWVAWCTSTDHTANQGQMQSRRTITSIDFLHSRINSRYNLEVATGASPMAYPRPPGHPNSTKSSCLLVT